MQSLWKSFPGSVEPRQPTVCSSKTPVGPGSWGLGLFTSVLLRKECSHCDVQQANIWLQDDCQVYCLSPFCCPRSGDPWGFALLCKGEAWLRPLGEHILQWQLPLGVFLATTARVVGGELVTHVPLCPSSSQRGQHTSALASGQHFPRDDLPAQNKLELWIYSACKTSAGINNWESKGFSVERTSGSCSCLPPSHHPFLWKWSQLHW